MSWIEYWNGSPSIYVNDLHKAVHYRGVAGGIGRHVPDRGTVLDHGCGEALFAGEVARGCAHLYLYDAAPAVREALQRRFAGEPRITVLDDIGLAGLADGAIDLVVANSVIQYLDETSLVAALDLWKRLLASDGRLLVADVIPRSVGPATDALSLLSFAGRNGFLVAAVAGLLRTLFSDYRKLRGSLGIAKFEEREVVEILARQGLAAERVHPNLGHNQSRMAFMARLAVPRSARDARRVA